MNRAPTVQKPCAHALIPYIMMMPPTCGDPRWAGILRFQMDWNPLPMILLELTMVRVLPAQEIPQQPCLPPGQRHHDHGAGLAGVHAGGVLLGRCASQCFRNEMPDGLRP